MFPKRVFNPHPVIRGLWGPGMHENCHYLKLSLNLVPSLHVIFKMLPDIVPECFCIQLANKKIIISKLMKTLRRPPTGPPRPGSCSSLLWLRYKSTKHWKKVGWSLFSSVVNGMNNDRYKSLEVQKNRLQCNSKSNMLITQSCIYILQCNNRRDSQQAVCQ